MQLNTENFPTPGKTAEALHWNVEQCTKFAMDLLEEANCHGAAMLIDMYREQGYPSLTDVNVLIKKIQKEKNEMTDTKHSPAPWKVVIDHTMPDEEHWKIEAADRAEIAQNSPWDIDTKTSWANARVMALAPEMLKLLRRMLNGGLQENSFGDPDISNDVALQIDDVIKRAEGKTT